MRLTLIFVLSFLINACAQTPEKKIRLLPRIHLLTGTVKPFRKMYVQSFVMEQRKPHLRVNSGITMKKERTLAWDVELLCSRVQRSTSRVVVGQVFTMY